MSKAKELLTLIEAIEGNWFSFGKLGVTLPLDDKDAEQMKHSMGASGFEAYVSDATSQFSKDPNLFKDAARELSLGMSKTKDYLEKHLNDSENIDMIMWDLKETLDWLNKGFLKSVQWDHSKKCWVQK